MLTGNSFLDSHFSFVNDARDYAEAFFDDPTGDHSDIAPVPPDPMRDFNPPEITADPEPVTDKEIYSTTAAGPDGSGSGFQIAGYNGYLVIVIVLVLINFLYNYFNK